MSLDLTLTAPPDLSVGRVRLTRGEREIGSWMASPAETQCQFESLNPGLYQALAEPLGQPSRSYLFLLSEDKPKVSMPSLQAMSSPGFAASNFQAVAGGMLRRVVGSAADALQDAVKPALEAIVGSSTAQPITIGLSLCADFEKGSTRPYASGPAPEITLVEGAVEFVLNPPENELTTQSFNLMLTCAVGGMHNLIVRIPLFAGGVRIACSASPLGNADITSRVMPADRNRRAITQALFAGSSTEAAAVFKTIPGGEQQLIGPEDWRTDPWTSVAACLLWFRFPDLAPPNLPVDLLTVARAYPSFSDAHVLMAREQLRQAGISEPLDRSAVLADVLQHLERGYDAGPPYFTYSAQLAEDMLSALATDKALSQRAASQLTRISRYARVARNAGASYAWRSAEIPSRSGSIDPRSATVVFSGWVSHDRLALDAKQTPSFSTALAQVAAPILAAFAKPVQRLLQTPASSKASWNDVILGLRDLATIAVSLGRGAASGKSDRLITQTEVQTTSDAPALGLPVTEPDDPHKGRFGMKDSVGGFTLAAEFAGDENAKVVPITLSVSGESGFESYDDVAEFFLHPTFQPDRLRAAFHGRSAEVRVVSLGGFTVGVWLPARGIELELDLAKVPGAPRIVREL
jgi:hypothetical protein